MIFRVFRGKLQILDRCLVTCMALCYTMPDKSNDSVRGTGNEDDMTKQEQIARLKAEKDAVILAHYYVSPEVQQVADYIGDSFYLSKQAQGLPNSVIVFCGVNFMGESGKLLSPEKKVLMPDLHADCPMAHMVTKEEVDRYRAEYPDLAVVCYINSTAEIKSWSDVCVTSANAVKVIGNLPNHHILFIPDRNLGTYVGQQLPEKHVMVVQGHCPIHANLSAGELLELKQAHPHAQVLVHPECSQEVRELADFIGSTSGIIQYATADENSEFIIATEVGVLYELQRRNPGKHFYFPKTTPVCPDMKTITLDKIIRVLKTGENAISVPDAMTAPAGRPLERMLELAK